ncbi:GerAB/ArcD/ProY family transporter [Virgibacillus kekensis]|uniref:GerAB/ArcD/ProY family transporter n=1 Tax=Virgibacillus kekensis TaxID=202261 RepID=A0ABV9DG95_9BACI
MIQEKDKVTGLMVFFLITASQVGVGVLGFQSIIIKYAEQDAWISIFVAGAAISIIIWIMYRMLGWNKTGDIVAIHQDAIGKLAGNFLSVIFAFYLLILSVVVLSTYLEIIQVWMFPHIDMMAILFLLLPLIYYIIAGEFRVVTGVSFFGVVYPSLLMLTLFYPFHFGHIANIMPVFDHTIKEILQSSRLTVINFLGVSILLVFYPYISDSSRSRRNALFGNLYTTILYVIICVVSFFYYSQEELKHIIWATLGMWKIIELPFLARFEYIGIATLFFSILPNVVLYTWASARTLHRTTGISHKKICVFLLIILFGACMTAQDRETVNLLNDMISRVGIVFLFVYIPLLFFLYLLRRKVKKNAA